MYSLREFLDRTSVIIPAYNNQDSLDNTLRSLEKVTGSDNSPMAVVVVDNNSNIPLVINDDIRSRLTEKNIHVDLLHEPQRGPAAARNTGWRHAAETYDSEYIAFVDCGCLFTESTLTGYHQNLANGVVAYQGKVESKGDDWLSEYYESSDALVPSCDNFNNPKYIITANVLVATHALQQTHGFNTQFEYAAGEDQELGLRLKAIGNIKFSDSSVAKHDWLEGDHDIPTGKDIKAFTARYTRYGRGQNTVHELHPPSLISVLKESVRMRLEGNDGLLSAIEELPDNTQIVTPYQDERMKALQKAAFTRGYRLQQEERNQRIMTQESLAR